jgi:hypothetical protein
MKTYALNNCTSGEIEINSYGATGSQNHSGHKLKIFHNFQLGIKVLSSSSFIP